jgi:hypothetical protein
LRTTATEFSFFFCAKYPHFGLPSERCELVHPKYFSNKNEPLGTETKTNHTQQNPVRSLYALL